MTTAKKHMDSHKLPLLASAEALPMGCPVHNAQGQRHCLLEAKAWSMDLQDFCARCRKPAHLGRATMRLWAQTLRTLTTGVVHMHPALETQSKISTKAIPALSNTLQTPEPKLLPNSLRPKLLRIARIPDCPIPHSPNLPDSKTQRPHTPKPLVAHAPNIP